MNTRINAVPEFSSRRPLHSRLTVMLCLAFAALPAAAQNNARGAATRCDTSCLTAAIDDYLAKITSHRAGEIKIAPNARIYCNTRAGSLAENPLGRVKTVKSKQVVADPETGNVVARTGVELVDGKIAYASSRLKIVNGTITQVETSFDEGRVVASYVTALNPLFTQAVPPEQRASRPELKAIIERYFQALTDHKPAAADYSDTCDRYHSGQKITNNSANTVEAGRGAMTCYSSVLGNRPWGPATDIHIPVIDPEHGVVVGYTLLMYQDGSAPMYVSEMFKVSGGKIQMIDNIGLKAVGLQAMNFPD